MMANLVKQENSFDTACQKHGEIERILNESNTCCKDSFTESENGNISSQGGNATSSTSGDLQVDRSDVPVQIAVKVEDVLIPVSSVVLTDQSFTQVYETVNVTSDGTSTDKGNENLTFLILNDRRYQCQNNETGDDLTCQIFVTNTDIQEAEDGKVNSGEQNDVEVSKHEALASCKEITSDISKPESNEDDSDEISSHEVLLETPTDIMHNTQMNDQTTSPNANQSDSESSDCQKSPQVCKNCKQPFTSVCPCRCTSSCFRCKTGDGNVPKDIILKHMSGQKSTYAAGVHTRTRSSSSARTRQSGQQEDQTNVKKHQFKCFECNKIYISSSHFNIHMRKIHPSRLQQNRENKGEPMNCTGNSANVEPSLNMLNSSREVERNVCGEDNVVLSSLLENTRKPHVGDYVVLNSPTENMRKPHIGDYVILNSPKENMRKPHVGDYVILNSPTENMKKPCVGDYVILNSPTEIMKKPCVRDCVVLNSPMENKRKPCVGDYVILNSLKKCQRQHICNHTLECNIKGKSLSSSSSSKTHNLHVSNKEKEFKCDICEYICSNNSDLKVHQETLHQDDPVKCRMCKASFKDKSSLTIHMTKFHTFEKPFECSFCHRRFVSEDDHLDHIWEHHKEQLDSTHGTQDNTKHMRLPGSERTKTSVLKLTKSKHVDIHGGVTSFPKRMQEFTNTKSKNVCSDNDPGSSENSSLQSNISVSDREMMCDAAVSKQVEDEYYESDHVEDSPKTNPRGAGHTTPTETSDNSHDKSPKIKQRQQTCNKCEEKYTSSESCRCMKMCIRCKTCGKVFHGDSAKELILAHLAEHGSIDFIMFTDTETRGKQSSETRMFQDQELQITEKPFTPRIENPGLNSVQSEEAEADEWSNVTRYDLESDHELTQPEQENYSAEENSQKDYSPQDANTDIAVSSTCSRKATTGEEKTDSSKETCQSLDSHDDPGKYNKKLTKRKTFSACSYLQKVKSIKRCRTVTKPTEKFECRECGEVYTRKDHSARYVPECNKTGDKECETCGKFFVQQQQQHTLYQKQHKHSSKETGAVHATVSLVNGHSASGQGDSKEYQPMIRKQWQQCDLCAFKCIGKYKFVQHQRNVHDLKPFKCERCDAKYRFEESLQFHVRNHHMSDNIFICEVCLKPFFSSKECHSHEVSCRTLKDKDHKRLHILNHANPARKFKCLKCEKDYASGRGLRRHMLVEHLKITPYHCDICNHGFYERTVLNVHYQRHAGVKSFLCDVCSETFVTNAELKIHVRINHTNRERSFMCDVCDSKCFTKEQLKNHLRIHTGEKPCKCKYCGKSFRTSSQLTKHHRVHTGEKKWVCKVCDKRFTQVSQLRDHDLVHTGIRKYKCQLCGMAFKRPSAVKAHQQVHTGLKPYKCTLCEKGLGSLTALKKHKAWHEKIEKKSLTCSDSKKKCRGSPRTSTKKVAKKHL